ncbi:hypothetical protein GOODEAATRI_015272 [Goodea atripinnis]|uniref:Speriolin C-terminal domain-containing protein n=1 Tax=Goodea atripinnis TaxID=208336 RepID=A0ABV0NC76_9TELE
MTTEKADYTPVEVGSSQPPGPGNPNFPAVFGVNVPGPEVHGGGVLAPGGLPYPPPPVAFAPVVPGIYGAALKPQDGSSGYVNPMYPGYPENAPPYSPPAPGFVDTYSGECAYTCHYIVVYLVLTAQLMVTFAFVAIFTFVKEVKVFVLRNTWTYFLSYAVFFVSVCVISCCGNVRRRHPWNLVALVRQTGFCNRKRMRRRSVSLSFPTFQSSFWTSQRNGCNIIANLVSGPQTKYDFTSCYGVLFVCLLVLIFFSILCIFLQNIILQIVYAGLGALLFTAVSTHPLTGKVDEGYQLHLTKRYTDLMEELSQLEYKAALHPPFCEFIINTYGILKERPSKHSSQGTEYNNPDFLMKLIENIAPRRLQKDLLLVLSCLCYMAVKDKKPLLAW